MNRIGFSTRGLFWFKGRSDQFLTKDTIRALAEIKKSGYETAEVSCRSTQKYQMIQQVAKQAKELGMEIYSIHFPKNTFEDIDKHLFKCIEFARFLECSVAVIHPPKDIDRLHNMLILKRAVAKAEKYGVLLTLENMPWMNSTHALHSLVEEYSMGVTLDFEFIYASGIPLNDFLQIFKKKIANCHVRDYDGNPYDSNHRRRYLLPGRGNIDFGRDFQILKNSGYRKPLMVETAIHNPHELLKVKEFLQGVFYDSSNPIQSGC
ncbi:MAG: sugar phosphate isomerase/epimerase family protein [Candidatus Methanofastidiosia archaeon]